MVRILRCSWISIRYQRMMWHCYKSVSQCLVFCHSNSISPCLMFLPTGIGKYSGLDQLSRDSGQIGDYVVHLEVCKLCFFSVLTSKCICGLWLSWAPQIHNWQMIRSPLLHQTQYSTYAIYCEMGQPGMCNAAYQLTSSHNSNYY